MSDSVHSFAELVERGLLHAYHGDVVDHSARYAVRTGHYPSDLSGRTFTTVFPYQAIHEHHELNVNPQALPAVPPAGHSNIPLAAYEAYRATAQYVSPDGTTIQFQTGLKAGDPSTTAAMNAVPAIRAEAAAVARTLQATAYGVGGEAPAF